MTMQAGIPVINTFGVSSIGSGTTVAALLIPPCPGPIGNPAYLFNAQAANTPKVPALSATKANWLAAPNFGVTHITSLQVIASSTSHTLLVLRPLNWTYFPAGLPASTTVIPNSALTGIADDPGIYSTNYKYPTAGAVAPAGAADAAISSTNKAVCYQLADGSWQYDTIASGTFGSTLTLTTGTPSTAAILAGAPMYYFGAVAGTLKDPATGLVGFGIATTVSVTTNLSDSLIGEYSGIHVGDPLLIYDANGTAADSLVCTGYYGGY